MPCVGWETKIKHNYNILELRKMHLLYCWNFLAIYYL